jgi:hypothetical protein
MVFAFPDRLIYNFHQMSVENHQYLTDRSIHRVVSGEPLPILPVEETLFTEENPFKIESLHRPELEHPPRIASFFGTFHENGFVGIANNFPGDRDSFSEPVINGLFKIDRINGRILFEPGNGLPVYDSYRQRGKIFQYEGTVVDLISNLIARGKPLYQITTLHRLVLLYQPPRNAYVTLALAGRLQSEFSRQTGLNYLEAYQIDGPVTISQLVRGEYLTPRPLDKTFAKNYSRLSKQWGNSSQEE